jgi:DNA processing protein
MQLKYLLAALHWQSINTTGLQMILSSEASANSKVDFIFQYLNLDKDIIDNVKRYSEKLNKWFESKRLNLMTPFDLDYPKVLLSHPSPPYLSYWGNPKLLDQKVLAIVGSRSPSVESRDWIKSELVDFLLEYKTPIVSGGARGVDMEIHKACISTQCPTICFIPSGMSQLYPPELYHWIEPILETDGIIVSPFDPFERIYKGNFHFRNELMVMISNATLVIEARLRSGSMLSANKAIKWGRELAALPVHPMQVGGSGNLKLLQDGAQMIINSEDLKLFWSRNLISCHINFVNS